MALTDVVCHTISHELFEQVMARRPQLAEDLSAILSQRQTNLARQREGLSAEAAAQREAEERNRTLARIKAFFGLG